MVEHIVTAGHLRSAALERAVRTVPRHRFVLEASLQEAYPNADGNKYFTRLVITTRSPSTASTQERRGFGPVRDMIGEHVRAGRRSRRGRVNGPDQTQWWMTCVYIRPRPHSAFQRPATGPASRESRR